MVNVFSAVSDFISASCCIQRNNIITSLLHLVLNNSFSTVAVTTATKTMVKLQFKIFEKEKKHNLQDTAFPIKELQFLMAKNLADIDS